MLFSFEHLLHYKKAVFHNDATRAQLILCTGRPDQAKRIGVQIKKSKHWLESELDVMINLYMLKAEQHPVFRHTLINSAPHTLEHNMDMDSKWVRMVRVTSCVG